MPEGDDSVEDYLRRIQVNSQMWDTDGQTGPVGRIVDVYFADGADGVEGFRDRLDNLREESGVGTSHRIFGGSWTLSHLLENLHDTLTILEEDDEPIVVVVELPNEARFGQLFRRPVAPDDRFLQLCKAVGADVGFADDLDTGVIIGREVPVAREGTDWRIDFSRAVD